MGATNEPALMTPARPVRRSSKTAIPSNPASATNPQEESCAYSTRAFWFQRSAAVTPAPPRTALGREAAAMCETTSTRRGFVLDATAPHWKTEGVGGTARHDEETNRKKGLGAEARGRLSFGTSAPMARAGRASNPTGRSEALSMSASDSGLAWRRQNSSPVRAVGSALLVRR